MEIRLLRPEEAEKHFRCSAISFIWPLDITTETLSDDPRMGVFDDDGTLMAELTFVPHEVTYCGNTLTTVMIDEVISLPANRRSGYIRKLFEELEKMAPQEKWDIGTLNPFSWSYYRKFGYDRALSVMSLNVPMRSLERFERNCDVKLNEGALTEDLRRLYNNFCQNKHLKFLRKNGKHYQENPYGTCEYTYIWYDKSGAPRSYVIYNVDRSQRTVRVKEIIYDSPESLAGILGFLRNHDGQTDFVDFDELPTGSPLDVVLGDYDRSKSSVRSVLAGRVYNLQSVLERNSYPQEHGAFRLLSHDSMAQNNGLFEVEYQNGKAQVSRINSGAPDIEVTPIAAARLLLSGEGFTTDSARFIEGTTLHNEAKGFFAAQFGTL